MQIFITTPPQLAVEGIVYGSLYGFESTSDIYQNSSTTDGGGIYISGGTVVLDNADVVANTATEDGRYLYPQWNIEAFEFGLCRRDGTLLPECCERWWDLCQWEPNFHHGWF